MVKNTTLNKSLEDELNNLVSNDQILNNTTTTSEGYVLDARQGNMLQDQIAQLNSKITEYSLSTVTVNSTYGHYNVNNRIIKIGRVCTLVLQYVADTTVPSGTVIGTLPEGYRPLHTIGGHHICTNNMFVNVNISSTGNITIYSELKQLYGLFFTYTYVTSN